jgi:hypothetical protein
MGNKDGEGVLGQEQKASLPDDGDIEDCDTVQTKALGTCAQGSCLSTPLGRVKVSGGAAASRIAQVSRGLLVPSSADAFTGHRQPFHAEHQHALRRDPHGACDHHLRREQGAGRGVPGVSSALSATRPHTRRDSYEARWIVFSVCTGLERGLSFFTAPTLGSLSDYYGRRPVLVISLLFIALAQLLLGLHPTKGQ